MESSAAANNVPLERRAGRKKLAAFWVYQANPAANKAKTSPLKAYNQDCFRTRRSTVRIAANTKAESMAGSSPASILTKAYSRGGMIVSAVLVRPEKTIRNSCASSLILWIITGFFYPSIICKCQNQLTTSLKSNCTHALKLTAQFFTYKDTHLIRHSMAPFN
jgi:hypothetical protein